MSRGDYATVLPGFVPDPHHVGLVVDVMSEVDVLHPPRAQDYIVIGKVEDGEPFREFVGTYAEREFDPSSG